MMCRSGRDRHPLAQATHGRLFSVSRVLCLLLAWSVLGAGCNPGVDPESGDEPEAGTLHLISVRPVAAHDLLRGCGTFNEWYAGAPLPQGPFTKPHSSVKLARGRGADGSMAASLQWEKPDSLWSPQGAFSIAVPDAVPNTQHRLTVMAKSSLTTPAQINVYAVMTEDEWVAMALPLIEIPPKTDWETYEVTFQTGPVTDLRITMTAPEADGAPEEELLVDSMYLFAEGPAEWPEPQATGDNLIPNSSFEAWKPGELAPLGPFTPPSPGLGHAAAYPFRVVHPVGDVSLRMEWYENDRGDPPGTVFGVELSLEKNATYQFTVIAHMLNACSVLFQAFGVDEQGRNIPIANPLVEIPIQNQWQHYSGEFNTGDYTEVRIVMHGPSAAAFPVTALMDDWKLTKVVE